MAVNQPLNKDHILVSSSKALIEKRKQTFYKRIKKNPTTGSVTQMSLRKKMKIKSDREGEKKSSKYMQKHLSCSSVLHSDYIRLMPCWLHVNI